jgi:hypothetical protein
LTYSRCEYFSGCSDIPDSRFAHDKSRQEEAFKG